MKIIYNYTYTSCINAIIKLLHNSKLNNFKLGNNKKKYTYNVSYLYIIIIFKYKCKNSIKR